MVDSEEAARRLGVKLPTLYSYVSRGLIQSHPSPEGRLRLFDVADLNKMDRRGRVGRQSNKPSIHIHTSITEVSETGPSYRGKLASSLATSASFEEVAQLLWDTDQPLSWTPLDLPPPPEVSERHLLTWAAMMSGAMAPLASDMRHTSILDMASRLLPTMVDSLPLLGSNVDCELPLDPDRSVYGSLAARLVPRLTTRAVTPEIVRAVNAALVMLADHGLTPSTLAVRVAASSRTNFYNAMLVGLGVSSGPLIHMATERAYELLVLAQERGAEQAMDDSLRLRGVVPGVGRRLYLGVDPRFTALKPEYEKIASADQLAIIDSVLALANDHQLPLPNVDFALGALMFATDMTHTAGATIIAIARTAGRVAHYLEELEESPLRYRPVAL